MAISPMVEIQEGNGKMPAQDSLREISRRYNVDGIDDDGPNVSALRRNEFTKLDRKDMNRMGKRQEFMVSQTLSPLQSSNQRLLRISVEKLPPAFGRQFHRGVSGVMGVHVDVR